MKRNKVYTIWRNDDIGTVADWKDGYINHLEINGRDVPETITDEMVMEWAIETNEMYFDDEKANLDSVGNMMDGFLLIADIGRWNGRRFGYAEAHTFEEAMAKAIGRCELAHMFVENGEIKTTAHHHDGTNYVTIRAWRNGTTYEAMERVTGAIYNNADNAWNLINRHTRKLGQEVADVYGW